MTTPFIFLIRPLSVEKGYELECEGVLPDPLRFGRLFEAVLAAGQIGQDLDAEVQICDTVGSVVETMEIQKPRKAQLAAR